MKKLGLFLCCVLSIFVIASCTEETPDDGNKYTAGITIEQDTLTLQVGDEVTNEILLQGVKAINSKGEDIEVSVYHQIPVVDGKVSASGSYRVKYVAEADGTIFTEFRDVVVIYVAPVTDDLIVNGNLESGGIDPFTKSEFENGAGMLSVETSADGNKYLKLEMTSVAFSQGSPRINTNVFELDPAKYYEIQFTAWADVARTMHIQVGELLTVAPWYNQIGSGEWYADLTTEAQQFKFRFQPSMDGNANMANAQLLFEFGTMNNGQSAVTNCYLDDIQIVEVDDLGLESILKAETMLEFGEEAAAQATPNQVVVWYDQGGWCGAPSVVKTTVENGEVTLNATQPEGSCWFATQMFLYTGALEAANYKLTFNLNMSKAGRVTVCGKVFDVVAGDNAITIEKEVSKGGQFGLAVQLGVDGEGNMGDAVAVISKILLINNGPIKEPVDYADPENLFGTWTELVNGGQADAEKTHNKMFFWHVEDVAWSCGPAVNATASATNGIISLHAVQDETHYWFATQLFYTTKPFETAGDHTLTFDLVSNVAGEITVCGTKMAIVAGTNHMEVKFTSAVDASFLFSLQLGWLEGDNVSHPLVGDVQFELSNFAIDGQTQGTPTPDKTQLSKPVGVVVNPVAEGHIVAFAPVDNAASYKVYVYNGEAEVYTQTVTNGGLITFTTPGTYTVKVQAVGDGVTYSDSELSDPVNWTIAGTDPTPTPDKTQLTKPVGVVVNPVAEGYIAAFAPVDNAASYKVYVYSGETLVHEQTVTNGGLITFTTPGTYTVKVQAIGDGVAYTDSELSDPVNWTLA